MDKIIKGTIVTYTATDGRVFIGKEKAVAAKKHQNWINIREGSDKFDIFLRQLFDIDISKDPNMEEKFCDDMASKVKICVEEMDFGLEVSDFLLDLFAFIGPEKWIKIHNFLTKKE